MKKIIFITLLMLVSCFVNAQNYDKGLLIYRLTTAQRTALPANTAAGILVYDTTAKSLWIYNGVQWVEEMAAKSNGDLGVGVTTPAAKLDVNGYIKVGSSDTTGDAAPVGGMIRYNSATSTFQGYNGTTWVRANSYFVKIC